MDILKRVRAYWNNQPCNIRHSKEPVGTRQFFYDVEAKKYKVEGHIYKFAGFSNWHGKKVLEIGCGIGSDTVNFARSGAQVIAIDISEKSLEIARKRAEILNFSDRITFFQGNAEELDKIVPLQEFDLIWSFGVIHHTPNPEKVVECIKKYMSSSTQLRLMVYNKFSWKVFWILLKYGKGAFWNLDKLVAQHSEAQTGCPVTYTYSKESVKKLLNGFNIEKINIYHIFPYKILEYKEGKYKKVWYFRYLPDEVFWWLEKKIGWHMCVTAKLKKFFL